MPSTPSPGAVSHKAAYFGAGCFWCTEAVFSRLKGVISVRPGYAGGTSPNPTYEEVSTGTTGHAEVAEVLYDPDIISYDDLLTVFFGTHDPTTRDRQGSDVGPQYRSLILTTDAKQARSAKAFIAGLERDRVFDKPVVTGIQPFEVFYPAEEYHVRYFEKHHGAPYCQVVITPKVNKLRQKFKPLMQEHI